MGWYDYASIWFEMYARSACMMFGSLVDIFTWEFSEENSGLCGMAVSMWNCNGFILWLSSEWWNMLYK